MTTRAKHRTLKKDAEKLVEINHELKNANDQLLDLLNAILYANGGKVVISQAQLVAADRRGVEVTHSPQGVVIESADTEEQRPLNRLWLPGGTS